jgi:hypothetical protein
MTTYRILFFKNGYKRVDLPFGFIAAVDYNDKLCKITFHLKYPHSWKFYIINSHKNYGYFKNFGYIYYKTKEVRNLFAFQYALAY